MPKMPRNLEIRIMPSGERSMRCAHLRIYWKLSARSESTSARTRSIWSGLISASNCSAAEGKPPSRASAEQHPPDRNGKLFRDALYRTTAYRAWSRCASSPSVRPFLKGHKNDYHDAEAIAEAVQRPTMHFVSFKTSEQMDSASATECQLFLAADMPQRTGV
jgi:hypothetical protein